MKNLKPPLILFSFFFFLISFSINAQSLTPYAGNWKMTPMDLNNKFSKLTIVDNGNYVTIKLKESQEKNVTTSPSGRINPSSNRIETYLDGIGYYLLLNADNTILQIVELGSNTKIGDFKK